MPDKVTEIWNNFDQQLKKMICTKMNNRDECHDVLQDVYIKIINNVDRITSVENMPSYLNRLAANAVLDHFRKEAKTPVESLDADRKIVIVDEVDGNDEVGKGCYHCLQPGIDTLPDIYKEALLLSDIEGMPQKDIATKLGISVSGAKSRVQRAREKLKEEVLKCCSTYNW